MKVSIRRMKIVSVVGARPQFIKASVLTPLLRQQHDEVLLHTGQHYDYAMSKLFFDELGLPEPKYNLGVGSGPQGAQTGAMLAGMEKILLDEKPDWTVVYGDTNSTLAGGLAAAKLHVPVAHVEAGLRSWNRKMPEEINRVMVDHLSSLLLCPSNRAVENLKKEGIVKGVVKTGDVMHDSAIYCAQKAEEHRENFDRICKEAHVEPGGYFLATVHRAENTDHLNRLERIVSAFERLPAKVVWPVHPRTLKELKTRNIACGKNIVLTEPFSYLDMLLFLKRAKTVLTDSGGVQKEALFFKVPCITLREETEWTETVDSGWNILTGIDAEEILSAVASHHKNRKQDPGEIYGDGNSGRNAIESLLSFFGEHSR